MNCSNLRLRRRQLLRLAAGAAALPALARIARAQAYPSPANNVAEFIAYVKANPGKLNMASTGKARLRSKLVERRLRAAGTPSEIVDLINREINVALTDPKIKARLTSLGSMAITGSPAAFAAFLAEETDKWGKVVRAANIKAE